MSDLAQLNLVIQTQQVEAATRALEKFVAVGKQAEAVGKNIKLSFDTVERSADSAERSTTRLNSSLLKLATVGTLVYQSFRAIQEASNFERTTIAFETLLGSAERAQKFVGDLIAFSEKSPFRYDSLIEASRFMLALGFSADEVLPKLRTIAQATAALGGSGQLMDRLILALGQMRAKGVVNAEEMRQLAEAGIPAWEILAKAIGTDIPTAMRLVENRAVDSTQALSVFFSELDNRFGGVLEKFENSLPGSFAILTNQIKLLTRDVGMELAKGLNVQGLSLDLGKGIREARPDLAQALRLFFDLSQEIGTSSDRAQFFLRILRDLSGIFAGLVVYGAATWLTPLVTRLAAAATSATSFVDAGAKMAVMLGPQGWLAVGVGLLVTILPELMRGLDESSESVLALQAAMREADSAAASLAGSLTRVENARIRGNLIEELDALESASEKIKQFQDAVLKMKDVDSRGKRQFTDQIDALRDLTNLLDDEGINQGFRKVVNSTADFEGAFSSAKDVIVDIPGAIAGMNQMLDALNARLTAARAGATSSGEAFDDLRGKMINANSAFSQVAKSLEERLIQNIDPRADAMNDAERALRSLFDRNRIAPTPEDIAQIRELAGVVFDLSERFKASADAADEATRSSEAYTRRQNELAGVVEQFVEAKERELAALQETNPALREGLELQNELLNRLDGMQVPGLEAVLEHLRELGALIQKAKETAKDSGLNDIELMIRATRDEIEAVGQGQLARDLAIATRRAEQQAIKDSIANSKELIATLQEEIKELARRRAELELTNQIRDLQDQQDLAGLRDEDLFATQALLDAQRRAEQQGVELSQERLANLEAEARATYRLTTEYERLFQATDTFGQIATDALGDILFQTESVADALRNLAESLIKLFVQYAALDPIAKGLSGAASGWFSGFIPGLTGAAPSAYGNAFLNGDIIPHDMGGIIDRLSLFPMRGGRWGSMAEGNKPEAIMPLARGSDGRLGVASVDGGQRASAGLMIGSVNFYTPNPNPFGRSERQVRRASSRTRR